MHDITQEKVWITGPRGRLSGELAYGPGAAVGSVLLIPPHPYMGGRMRLPLMNRLAETMASRGLTTLRFDYGGVGESEGPPIRLGPAMQQFWDTGSAPDDPVHVEEAAAALAWLERTTGATPALAGYSFGAGVAAKIHRPGTPAVALVAPTVLRHDYGCFRNEGTPTLVLFGDGDFATGEVEMKSWAAALPGGAELRHFPAGDHFFRGQEGQVAAAAAEFLERVLGGCKECAR